MKRSRKYLLTTIGIYTSSLSFAFTGSVFRADPNLVIYGSITVMTVGLLLLILMYVVW